MAALVCAAAPGQIVNRLRVDQKTFIRYAYGRMQEFSSDNLPLADSLYREGELQGNFRLKCLGLSICRDIAGRMGGKVFLDTTHTGKGARFVFTVPLEPVKKEA